MYKRLLVTDFDVREPRPVKPFNVKSDGKMKNPEEPTDSNQASVLSRCQLSKDYVTPHEYSNDRYTRSRDATYMPKSVHNSSFGRYRLPSLDGVDDDEMAFQRDIKKIEKDWDSVELRDTMRLNMYRITGVSSKHKLPSPVNKNNLPTTSKERLYNQVINKQRVQPNSRVLLRQIAKKTSTKMSHRQEINPFDLYIREMNDVDALQLQFTVDLRKTRISSMRHMPERPLNQSQDDAKMPERSRSAQGCRDARQSQTGKIADDFAKAYGSRNKKDKLYMTRLHRLMRDTNMSLNRGRL